MVLIQALLSFLGKSVGKVGNAIFGWAVIALFGRTSPRQQVILSGVVAMAALWPLLLVGVVAPKTAALFIAFVPLAKSVPDGVIRAIWIGLTLIVPLLVGFVIAGKSAPETKREPVLKRVLRGFPITVALAAAFLILFVTVPVLRLASILKGRSDEHVPLITERGEYDQASAQIEGLIEANRLGVARAAPPWWMVAPVSILRRLGGRAVSGFMPERLAYWKSRDLQIALYPSDVLVRGAKLRAAWTHGLIAETFGRGPGLQTFDPEAQEIERQVHRVWEVYEKEPAHVRSRILEGRVVEMARDLSRLDVSYEQWQIAYRKIAQLARAIGGDPQLLESATKGELMRTQTSREPAPAPRPLEGASTGELLGQFFHQTNDLLKKELELAKAEIQSSVNSIMTMTLGFAAAAVFGLLGLGLLSAAAVLALAQSMKPWLSALIVGVAMLVIAAIVGSIAKSKRVQKPLERTQKTLKEDVQWVKERLA